MTLIDGRRSVHFPDDSSESVCWIHIATYSLRGVNVLFGGLWPLAYFLTFDFEAIIDFN